MNNKNKESVDECSNPNKETKNPSVHMLFNKSFVVSRDSNKKLDITEFLGKFFYLSAKRFFYSLPSSTGFRMHRFL